MSKTILFVICEGEKSKTEWNFLKKFKEDKKSFLTINKNLSKVDKELYEKNELLFEVKKINYKDITQLFDTNLTFSKIVVYIDNDKENAFKYVKDIIKKENDQIKIKTDKIVFVHPSPEKAFEELISFFFKKPRKIYSGKDLTKLQEMLGKKFKGDKKIYEKVLKKGNYR